MLASPVHAPRSSLGPTADMACVERGAWTAAASSGVTCPRRRSAVRERAEDEHRVVEPGVVGRDEGDVGRPGGAGHAHALAPPGVGSGEGEGEVRVRGDEGAQLAPRIPAGPQHTDRNLMHGE